MSFDDLQRHVLDNVYMDTRFFAERALFRTAEDTEGRWITVHAFRSQEMVTDERGNECLKETVKVKLRNEDVNRPGKYGDSLTFEGDDRAYLFAYDGKIRKHWRIVMFERRTQTAAGRR